MPNPPAVECAPETTPDFHRVAAKVVKGVLIFTGLWALVLFSSAGTLWWGRGWLCLGLYVCSVTVSSVCSLRTNPQLLAERMRKHSGTKQFDKVILLIGAVLFAIQAVLAGFDAVRFHWSTLGPYSVFLGSAAFVAAMIPIAAATMVNPHLEKTVRLQFERGHRVIEAGPYRFVRHPMYLGTILQSLAIPVILDSRWALIPAAATAFLYVCRTALEDRTLQRELPGYEAFTHRTRYRLIPGIW